MLNLLAAALTCVIIVPSDHRPGNVRPDIVEMHEMTHCKGWRDDGNIIPPVEWQRKPWPRGLQLEVNRVPTDVAEKMCAAVGGNSYACQFCEPRDACKAAGLSD